MARQMALGRIPDPLSLTLSPEASLVLRFRLTSADNWPPGTKIYLGIQLGPRAAEQRWTFQISGDTAALTVPKAELVPFVRRVNRDSKARLWLDYGPGSGGEFLWAAGPVQVRG